MRAGVADATGRLAGSCLDRSETLGSPVQDISRQADRSTTP